MNHNVSTFSAYVSALITTAISLFRPEEWMVIGIIVGIVATIFTAIINAIFRIKEHRLKQHHYQSKPQAGARTGSRQ
ncbi:MAG: phage holin [Plesiomonas sp.]|uniref:phage holin n=1 Tax=Plesiomonas sp. TaxID=2486279 RepID=UPI003F2B47F4